ncbi:hypothetical protein P4K96_19110, partial [Bacillus cereus]|nr:hypothetical protein [Bacillus cereus]
PPLSSGNTPRRPSAPASGMLLGVWGSQVAETRWEDVFVTPAIKPEIIAIRFNGPYNRVRS